MRTAGVRIAALAALAGALLVGTAAAETISGSITGSDPVHPKTVFDNGVASACPSAKPYPGTLAASGDGWHYDTYTRTNSTGSPECFTIQLQVLAGSAASGAMSSAYTVFHPNLPAEEYLGDIGSPVTPGHSRTFSIVVQGGASFTVVVEEYDEGANPIDYNLSINGAPATAVTLASASATRTRRGVAVRWRTGSETQVLGFNVYREQAGRRVRLNRTLIASGSSLSGREYVFADRSAPAGRLHYWLQTVSLDGTKSWRGPLAVRYYEAVRTAVEPAHCLRPSRPTTCRRYV